MLTWSKLEADKNRISLGITKTTPVLELGYDDIKLLVVEEVDDALGTASEWDADGKPTAYVNQWWRIVIDDKRKCFNVMPTKQECLLFLLECIKDREKYHLELIEKSKVGLKKLESLTKEVVNWHD